MAQPVLMQLCRLQSLYNIVSQKRARFARTLFLFFWGENPADLFVQGS